MKKKRNVYVILGLLSVLGLYNQISKKEIIFIEGGKVRTAIEICFFIGLVSFVFIEALIVQSTIKKHTEKSDYLVILGAGLSGKIPSIPLLQRLNASLEYIGINPNIKIVVSGGRGTDESITEAEAMKRFLIKHGVANEQIKKNSLAILIKIIILC